MEEMGHTDPKMTLGVYTSVMRWGTGERELLRALAAGEPASRHMPNVIPEESSVTSVQAVAM